MVKMRVGVLDGLEWDELRVERSEVGMEGYVVEKMGGGSALSAGYLASLQNCLLLK